MKIAIDVDEVLRETVTGFCEYYNKNYRGNISLSDFSAYNISEVLNVSSEEAHRLLDEYCLSEDFKSVDAVAHAPEVISILKKSHELVVVTASPDWMKDMTWEFFDEYYPGAFSDMIFSAEHYPDEQSKKKDEICKDIGADLIVEDSLFSIDYAKNGVKVLLLTRPWNKELEHENIIRCNCWNEVLSEIRRMENGS